MIYGDLVLNSDTIPQTNEVNPSQPLRDEVIAIICRCLREVSAGLPSSNQPPPGSDTRLFGSKSALDSVGLVNLLADVEETISVRFGKDFVLADEQAMSRTHSPFRRVDSLADYIVEKLSEPRS